MPIENLDEPTTAAGKYEREMGDEARRRQQRLARERFMCCGQPREGDHHFMCRNFKPPEIDPNQESLL